jgi:hypothetical protein
MNSVLVRSARVGRSRQRLHRNGAIARSSIVYHSARETLRECGPEQGAITRDRRRSDDQGIVR